MRTESQSASELLGEPDYTEDMSLTNNGGSVTVTIPSAAVKFLDYKVGEERRVEVYDDGVFIPREAPDE